LFGGFEAAVRRRRGRVDAQHEDVLVCAASAGDDGENEVDVTIGQPIDGSAEIFEVDEDEVVVHPAASKPPKEGKGEDADTTTSATSSKASNDEEPFVLESVPPASHSLEMSDTGPADGTVTTLTVHLGAPGHPDPIVIQTGKVGRQAAGAVTLTRGDTVLYATAARDSQPKDNIDFLPLSVEHQERFSSAGLTSGSYNKRDGRVSCKVRCFHFPIRSKGDNRDNVHSHANLYYRNCIGFFVYPRLALTITIPLCCFVYT